MGHPPSRGIRLSSIDMCGSKVNVIVSMHMQYVCIACCALSDGHTQQKIESMHDGHATSMQKRHDSWTRSLEVHRD